MEAGREADAASPLGRNQGYTDIIGMAFLENDIVEESLRVVCILVILAAVDVYRPVLYGGNIPSTYFIGRQAKDAGLVGALIYVQGELPQKVILAGFYDWAKLVIVEMIAPIFRICRERGIPRHLHPLSPDFNYLGSWNGNGYISNRLNLFFQTHMKASRPVLCIGYCLGLVT